MCAWVYLTLVLPIQYKVLPSIFFELVLLLSCIASVVVFTPTLVFSVSYLLEARRRANATRSLILITHFLFSEFYLSSLTPWMILWYLPKTTSGNLFSQVLRPTEQTLRYLNKWFLFGFSVDASKKATEPCPSSIYSSLSFSLNISRFQNILYLPTF